ncbi:MAG: recombination protein NinG [bacterium]
MMAERRTLTPKEKGERTRQRMIEKAKEFQVGTYIRKFVAPLFQRMIRAEWARCRDGTVPAIVEGTLKQVWRRRGQCVCVTCGAVGPWSSGLGGMHTGHFLASRRNSIVFEEDNVAPQCSRCNRYLSGAPQAFRRWMLAVRGEKAVEQLERLKTQSRQFSRADLVDLRILYKARLDAAIARMHNG